MSWSNTDKTNATRLPRAVSTDEGASNSRSRSSNADKPSAARLPRAVSTDEGASNSRSRSSSAAKPSPTRLPRAVSTDEGASNSQSRSSKWQADRPEGTYTGLKAHRCPRNQSGLTRAVTDAKPNSCRVSTWLKASDSRDRCFARSTGHRRSGKGKDGRGWRGRVSIITGHTAHRYGNSKKSPRRQSTPRQ